MIPQRLCVFLLLCTVAQVCCTPVRGKVFPILVPPDKNATNYGHDDIFCVVPSPWSNVIVFYLGNYAAHAATVVTYPGEAPISIAAAILYFLFFPTTGVVRGLNAIFRHARFPWYGQTHLRAAARAGALCMVVRTQHWRPLTNESQDVTDQEERQWHIIEGAWCRELPRLWPYFDTSLERPQPSRIPMDGTPTLKKLWEYCTDMERKIHGSCKLPDNGYYALAYVPRNAKVESVHEVAGQDIPTILSSSYSFVRAAIAVIQVLYASSTLYKATKGPQIERYGYAAFGLTVVPYLIMSLVNLGGNLLTANYDALYIVDSPILWEAVKDHDAKIDGIVGTLVMKQDSTVEVEIDDTTEKKLLSRAMTMAFPSTPNHRMPTSLPASKTENPKHLWDTNEVTPYLANAKKYSIFFSCPVIERTDKILQKPRTLSARPGGPDAARTWNFKKVWAGYFNPENRSDIDIPWYSYLFFTSTSLLLGSLSLLPVGIISKFHENSSTHEQRGWIQCWMVFGIVNGTLVGWWMSVLEFRSRKVPGWSQWVKFGGIVFFAAVLGVPGVGAFVMVGKMLREYGNCVSFF